jgi:hypothetical protein
MTSPRNGSPTRGLVLGGGSAVGVGWQTGLLTGLGEAGIDLAGAESIVGTSAGALLGALLSSGREVTDALASLAALAQSIDPAADPNTGGYAAAPTTPPPPGPTSDADTAPDDATDPSNPAKPSASYRANQGCSVCRDTPTFEATCGTLRPSAITANTA